MKINRPEVSRVHLGALIEVLGLGLALLCEDLRRRNLQPLAQPGATGAAVGLDRQAQPKRGNVAFIGTLSGPYKDPYEDQAELQ